MAPSDPADAPYEVLLYYRYADLPSADVDALLASQKTLCASLGLLGRVRISEEGINGTLGGDPASIQGYIDAVESSVDAFVGLEIDWKRSPADVLPFEDLILRRVKEIVSIELPDDECHVANTGVHLSPTDFHAAMLDATTTTNKDAIAVIDVRNNYEYNIGHFKDAMNPSTRRFGQFPQWVRDHLPLLQQKDRILMYCTGGIRCEKASSYLKHLGLTNVYQLQGGIHRYLEAFPDGGAFVGKNFVFDQRVAVASENDHVVGVCQGCNVSHDAISGIRCSYCRMHVMLCGDCYDPTTTPIVFCPEHTWMGDGSPAELATKLKTLEAQLLVPANVGPKGKGRRRSIRKQMDAIEAVVQHHRPDDVDRDVTNNGDDRRVA
ncbi:Aste57867_19271 [Aphanomyces stellatus]|uniref:Aste57867_19271 protein n=1 Tax=Aphanomyces stellatus TaxID=120398 RepID=A0A485LCC4_9STRA|nr:hypothetical protein As57867_019207 [Aphanomyces stellatus]VFT95991.1 Aste57867_19271 [Aphanomyces stellatus]